MRPRDEALEAFDGGRWRRNEPRHFLRRQRREERGRVFHAQFSERHQRPGEDRQAGAPVMPMQSRPDDRDRRHNRVDVGLRLEGHLLH